MGTNREACQPQLYSVPSGEMKEKENWLTDWLKPQHGYQDSKVELTPHTLYFSAIECSTSISYHPELHVKSVD